jgi:hypothetical protein
MPIRIRLAPLVVIIQPIRPNMTAPTINLRTCPIPTPQQRQRTPPIPRRTLAIKRRRLPNAQRVRDFVHGCALVHVCAVGAEAQVAVEVGLRGGHAGRVGDADGFGGGRVFGVARDGVLHGERDACVRVGLVGCGVGGACERPVQRCGGAAGVGGYAEEEGDAHVGRRGCIWNAGSEVWMGGAEVEKNVYVCRTTCTYTKVVDIR